MNDKNIIISADFDRIAALEPEKWNHNIHYYNRIIKKAKKCPSGNAYDFGCGDGALCRLLSPHFDNVTGVDISQKMLEKAAACKQQNVTYLKADIMAHELPEASVSCIVSVATAHHLPYREFLQKCRRALTAGGKLIIVDLYKTRSPTDYICGAAASLPSRIRRYLSNGNPGYSAEAAAAWHEHGKNDVYMTMRDLRKTVREVLPDAEFRRALYYRYTLVYTKK